MSHLKTALLLAAIAGIIASGPAIAQTTQKEPPPNSGPASATTANPELQKQLAPQRRAEKKQRRDKCEQEARQQKLRFAKRWRFMRRCMKG